MEKSGINYPKSWLNNTKLVRRKKFDFSLVGMCSVLLLLSIFISFIPILIQVIIELSNGGMLKSTEKTFFEFLKTVICKNDFRYISISVLFILFVERSLLSNERNTKFIDVISFVWFFIVVIVWLLMTANENVIDYINKKIEDGVFHLSIGFFVGTIIICLMNIIWKCTKIKYVYESVRR